MKIALVTGTNRGIGKEIVRQLSAIDDITVIATGRQKDKVEAEFKDLDNVVSMKLDVTSEEDMKIATAELSSRFGRLDILINNAGIMGNKPMQAFDMAEMRTVMESNFFGPVQLVKEVMPLLQKSDDARIINMSSGMGEMAGMQSGGYAAYRMSKWALNGFTMLLGSEMRDSKVKVFSMCPGWVRTDMGGAGAPRDVKQGADTAVWLAVSPKVEGTKFYRDREIIRW